MLDAVNYVKQACRPLEVLVVREMVVGRKNYDFGRRDKARNGCEGRGKRLRRPVTMTVEIDE
jgi:hypothetical protein